ncbi:hypothetical protein ACFHYO_09160 [Paracoccus panacisoli]|uniref:Plasmid stabilization protein n=2 Tax=Paracoccus TaxID=265 RepID=A0A099GKP3_9RHOB|nr:hypothetical protein [Paracoccus sanguinis]KGJ23072.1 plasmid stabilization protein [Paracoccus sanguinis]QJD16562.1 plasmid stabilization protein [Paracoccus sanguinis]
MPRGDKDAYTDKQKRKAAHIAEGYEERGMSESRAEEIAWATVNKQDGGGNESGSGRETSRSEAARKGWETRRKNGNA